MRGGYHEVGSTRQTGLSPRGHARESKARKRGRAALNRTKKPKNSRQRRKKTKETDQTNGTISYRVPASVAVCNKPQREVGHSVHTTAISGLDKNIPDKTHGIFLHRNEPVYTGKAKAKWIPEKNEVKTKKKEQRIFR